MIDKVQLGNISALQRRKKEKNKPKKQKQNKKQNLSIIGSRTRVNRENDHYVHHYTIHADYYIFNPISVIYKNNGIVFPV